jgi:hypothetical protein
MEDVPMCLISVRKQSRASVPEVTFVPLHFFFSNRSLNVGDLLPTWAGRASDEFADFGRQAI